MRGPSLDLAGLRAPAAWEYALRFVFGGTVAVATTLLGARFGLAIGGMCLAFPSILPASLTLVRRHGGRDRAVDDARGARLGALGLAAFALVVYATVGRMPSPVVLAAATCAWIAVAAGSWFLVERARR
jgi:hypothetical protein